MCRIFNSSEDLVLLNQQNKTFMSFSNRCHRKKTGDSTTGH